MADLKIKGWIGLLRVPNLPTVPGDPLVGLCLAGGALGWNVLWLTLAALLLYAAGLILNDVADFEIDAHERPDRPLPSGTVNRNSAATAGYCCGIAGLLAAGLTNFATLAVAVLLLTLILVYTFITPRGSTLGLLAMGLCRAFSVGLGIAAAHPTAIPWLALTAALGIGGYIVAVSWLASGETQAHRLDGRRWLPLTFAALALTSILALRHDGQYILIMLSIALMALFRIGRQTVQLGKQPSPRKLSQAIGAYIRFLLFMQAAFCASQRQGLIVAALLIMLVPLSAHLGNRFHAS